MGIDESSARYRGFIELSSSQAETGAGFMVVSGGSGTWGHRASPGVPKSSRDLAAMEGLHREGNLSCQEPGLQL